MRFNKIFGALAAAGVIGALTAGTAHAQRTAGSEVPLPAGSNQAPGVVNTFLGTSLLASGSATFDSGNVNGARISGTLASAAYSLGGGLVGFYYQFSLDNPPSTTGIDIWRINGFQNASITDFGQMTTVDIDGATTLFNTPTVGASIPNTVRSAAGTDGGNVLTLGTASIAIVSPGGNPSTVFSPIFYVVVPGANADPTGGSSFAGVAAGFANSEGVVYTPVPGRGIVPEPGTVALLAAPLLGMVGVAARRRRAAK